MITFPLFAAPRNDPESPCMLKLPPLPNAAVHEHKVPRARIFAHSVMAGHNPNSPFFGTGSPAFVQPIRKIAFCSAATSNLGPNLLLMLNERVTTSRASAMKGGRSRITIYSSLTEILPTGFCGDGFNTIC